MKRLLYELAIACLFGIGYGLLIALALHLRGLSP